jgi:hypothetical protein
VKQILIPTTVKLTREMHDAIAEISYNGFDTKGAIMRRLIAEGLRAKGYAIRGSKKGSAK